MPASDFTVSAHSERYSNKLNVSSAVAALIGNHSVTRIWNRVTLSGTRFKHVRVRSAVSVLVGEHSVARIWNRATLSGTRYKHVHVRSAVAVHGDRRSRTGSPDSSCWI